MMPDLKKKEREAVPYRGMMPKLMKKEREVAS
jgi:hypothetical protein